MFYHSVCLHRSPVNQFLTSHSANLTNNKQLNKSRDFFLEIFKQENLDSGEKSSSLEDYRRPSKPAHRRPLIFSSETPIIPLETPSFSSESPRISSETTIFSLETPSFSSQTTKFLLETPRCFIRDPKHFA